ncbi:MAG TPA: copper-containing nitrite reductase [Anaerolineae bacterium]|nr:copper-containing nitrite reductase [Anaerolineae bacterium]
MPSYHSSRVSTLLTLGLVFVLLLGACGPIDEEPATSLPESGQNAAPEPALSEVQHGTTTAAAAPESGQDAAPAHQATAPAGQPVPPSQQGAASYTPDVSFTLETAIADGRLAFVGVGGAIDGMVNPTLQVGLGQVVQVTLINGDGALHDVAFPDFRAQSEQVMGQGSSTTTAFRADQEGEFFYFCTVPGHRQAGMEGLLVVGGDATQPDPEAEGQNLVRDPGDVPTPVGELPAQTVSVELETVELVGRLADGATYSFWTFDGTVPGPFLRVREGDTVELTLRNLDDSLMIHSIDLHAVTGPGGGAEVTQVPPGGEKVFTFKALNPGLYVYHCATPMVANHIANGMYGLILVEPEGGLPPVDREFYVMQGEIYTEGPVGQHGHQDLSVEKLLDEQPEYVVLNGAVGALTDLSPLRANTGETVRIFFGVGGPNLTSSFHVIGEIMDRVYDQGSLTAPPLTDVQTALVPAGGSVMVEFDLEVPGRYILVDHSLSRLERGLVGFLHVEGDDNQEVFHEGEAE